MIAALAQAQPGQWVRPSRATWISVAPMSFKRAKWTMSLFAASRGTRLKGLTSQQDEEPPSGCKESATLVPHTALSEGPLLMPSRFPSSCA